MSHLIERLGHRGDGVAKGPIYAPLTLPGEEVEGEVIGDRIAAPRILTPSDRRVKAPCAHYKSCGGCSLQHADDAFVAEWKLDLVRSLLASEGLAPEFRPVETSPAAARRRATFSARRTKKGAMVGFHARASDTLIAVPNCAILHADLQTALPQLELLAALAATRKSEIKLMVTASDAGLDVDVRDAKALDPETQQAVAEIMQTAKIARLSWNGELALQQAEPFQSIGGIRMTPPPGAFLQATKHGETALIRAVTQAVGSAKHIADLFAGCGTFALPLAREAEVHAVEGDQAMTDALTSAWRGADQVKKVTTKVRDLFREPLIAADLNRFDAVVIDPPRAGALAQMQQLAQSTVPRIAAVSCNPATFVRDAKILTGAGYSLDWVQVVDQFRWSTHVELAAQFTKGHMTG